ncbi:MAG: hypothetical protein JSW52_11655 [Candidatus Coatesbacteria bacterium]|nr:MAG: hypothetical protein JSW52_11655 [Candidatus Coatesbacteria bacterium]
MTNGVKNSWEEKKDRVIDILEPVLVAYLYIISVVSPLIGLILGIVLMTRAELEKNRRLGKNMMTISIIFLCLGVLCCVAYIAFYVIIVVFGTLAGTAPSYY